MGWRGAEVRMWSCVGVGGVMLGVVVWVAVGVAVKVAVGVVIWVGVGVGVGVVAWVAVGVSKAAVVTATTAASAHHLPIHHPSPARP